MICSLTCNHMFYEMYHRLFKSWSCVVYFLYMLYKLLTCAVQDIFICCVRKFTCCPRNSYMLSDFLSYVVQIFVICCVRYVHMLRNSWTTYMTFVQHMRWAVGIRCWNTLSKALHAVKGSLVQHMNCDVFLRVSEDCFYYCS